MENNLQKDETIIETAITKGKLEAVKVCKLLYGVTLKDAKEHVDKITIGLNLPKSKVDKKGCIVLFVVIAFIGLIVALCTGNSDKKETENVNKVDSSSNFSRGEPLLTKDQRDSILLALEFDEDGSHIASVEGIKNIMNNPGSFEHVETRYKNLGKKGLIIYTRFRGTNSFNAIVTQIYVSRIDTLGEVVSLHEYNPE